MTSASRQVFIISLGEKDEPIYWCLGDSKQKTCKQSGVIENNEQATLPDISQVAFVIALVPTRQVILRQASFQGSPRLAKAEVLAFQFEEELLEPVEHFQWAILNREDSDYALAGFRAEDMQAWQAKLQALGVTQDIILPDLFCLPFDNTSSVKKWRQHWLVRDGQWSGYCLPEKWNIKQLAQFEKAEISDTEEPFSSIIWPIAERKYLKKISLLPKKQTVNATALGLTAAGVLLALSALAITGISYKNAADMTNQQASNIYKQLFPNERVPNDVVKGIREKIRLLRHRHNERHFFELTEQAQQTLARIEYAKPDKLHFDGHQHEFTLTLSAPVVEPFSLVNDAALSISLERGQNSGEGILTIKETE